LQIISTIRRLKKQEIQQLENSLEEQFKNHFNREGIELLSRKSKFVQRESRLDGFTFLSLIVFNTDSLAYESLNDLATKLELDYGVEMTKQGLNDRFNEYAVQFLKISLGELLYKQLSESESLIQCAEFDRILIKDSVCFQVDESMADTFPGSGGSGSRANVRIQLEYDLLSGKVVDLSLNAFNDQDAVNAMLTLEVVNDGDLIVRDLAYMHLDALNGILGRLGHFLARLQPSRKVYQQQDGKVIELDFAEIARNMRKFNVQQIEETVFLGADLALQVRLFIYLLPKAVYQERMRKLNRNAKRQGRQLTDESKARAQLTLFLTSAPEEKISIDTAWKVYTLRWQIELAFKVWKSIWKIDKVKKVKQERLECYIWAKLFIIVISWSVLWFISKMLRQLYGKNLSFYKAMKTIVFYIDGLRQMLTGGPVTPGRYLAEFLLLSRKRHLLEKKKSGNYSPEILFGVFTVSSTGKVISMEDSCLA
jgi:hypothetical protein